MGRYATYYMPLPVFFQSRRQQNRKKKRPGSNCRKPGAAQEKIHSCKAAAATRSSTEPSSRAFAASSTQPRMFAYGISSASAARTKSNPPQQQLSIRPFA